MNATYLPLCPPDARPGRCWSCGGPCHSYKGSVHGWRCTACITRYLDEGAALADRFEAKERAKRHAKFRAALGAADNTSIRRGGGGCAASRTATTTTSTRSSNADDD